MKRILILIAALVFPLLAGATDFSAQAIPTANVISPTDYLTGFSNSVIPRKWTVQTILSLVSNTPSGTQSVVVAGANITVVTNASGNVVAYTVNGPSTNGYASTAYVDASTNALSGVLVTRITNATNDLSGILVTRITNATNDLSGVLITRIGNSTNDLNTVLRALITGSTNELYGIVVPTNRTITIDGTAQPLNADRTFTSAPQIANVTTPGAILTNGATFAVTFSNSGVAVTGTLVIGSSVIANTNTLQVDTPAGVKQFMVSSNGQTWFSNRMNFPNSGNGAQFVTAAPGGAWTISGNLTASSGTTTIGTLLNNKIQATGGGKFRFSDTSGDNAWAWIDFGTSSSANWPSLLVSNTPPVFHFRDANHVNWIPITASNVNSSGVGSFTNGVASYRSNSLGPVSFTFPASGATWTNPNNYSIEVYIDNTAVTGTAIAKNGTTILSGLIQGYPLGLQAGEYFSETYSVGTPTGRWSPFP